MLAKYRGISLHEYIQECMGNSARELRNFFVVSAEFAFLLQQTIAKKII